jgi:hypothetical protein
MRDDEAMRLADEVAAEKRAQLEGATAVLKPLTIVADLTVFAVSFWRYNIGLALSIGATVLAHFLIKAGLGLPIGYVLGKRSAQRLKMRRPNTKPEQAISAALATGPSHYYAKVVIRATVIAIAYLAAAWYVGRLSWPLVAMVFVYWLLLPFAVVWSWPEHSAQPLWGRSIIGAVGCIALACLAFAVIGSR